MGTRDNSSADGEYESWIADLAGGETSVRRLRKRLAAEREPVEEACPTCHGSATAHNGHLTAIAPA